jgi:hypothetical protein
MINEAKGIVEDVWQDTYVVSVAMFCSFLS